MWSTRNRPDRGNTVEASSDAPDHPSLRSHLHKASYPNLAQTARRGSLKWVRHETPVPRRNSWREMAAGRLPVERRVVPQTGAGPCVAVFRRQAVQLHLRLSKRPEPMKRQTLTPEHPGRTSKPDLMAYRKRRHTSDEILPSPKEHAGSVMAKDVIHRHGICVRIAAGLSSDNCPPFQQHLRTLELAIRPK